MSQNTLSGLLSKFIERTQPRHSVRYLSELSAELFGQEQKIPHTTIHRWLQSYVKRPRTWQDLVKVGVMLTLSGTEMDQLLAIAQHPSFMELKKKYKRKNQQNNDDFSQRLLEMAEQQMIDCLALNSLPFQVPPDSPYYLNHTGKMEQLQRQILSAECPSLITIEGMVGVGKTAFAKQICYNLRSYFTDGVLWAQMDQSAPGSILRQFAKSYGVELHEEIDIYAFSSHVRTILADKHALIVLDGVQNDTTVRAV